MNFKEQVLEIKILPSGLKLESKTVKMSGLFIKKKRYQDINMKSVEKNENPEPFCFQPPQQTVAPPLTVPIPCDMTPISVNAIRDPITLPPRARHLSELAALHTKLESQKDSYDELVQDMGARNVALEMENDSLKGELSILKNRLLAMQSASDRASKNYEMISQGLSAELHDALQREAATAETLAKVTAQLKTADGTIRLQSEAIINLNRDGEGTAELKKQLIEAKRGFQAADAMIDGQDSRIKKFEQEVAKLQDDKKGLEARVHQQQKELETLQRFQESAHRMHTAAKAEVASLNVTISQLKAAQPSDSTQLQAEIAELREEINEAALNAAVLRDTVIRLGKLKITETEAAPLKWYQKLIQEKAEMQHALDQYDKALEDARDNLKLSVLAKNEEMKKLEAKSQQLAISKQECSRLAEELRIQRLVTGQLRENFDRNTVAMEKLEIDLAAANERCKDKAAFVDGRIYDPDGIVGNLQLRIDELEKEVKGKEEKKESSSRVIRVKTGEAPVSATDASEVVHTFQLVIRLQSKDE